MTRYWTSALILLSLIWTADGGAADSRVKTLAELFPVIVPSPGVSPGPPVPAPLGEFVARTRPEYADFHACASATTGSQSLACSPLPPNGVGTSDLIRTPRFFDLSVTGGGTESFNIVNQCLSLRTTRRKVLGPVVFPDAATVTCPVDPENKEGIVIAHLVACYGKDDTGAGFDAGAFCRLATVCFEPEPNRGKCLKDYRSTDEIRLAFKGPPLVEALPPSGPPPGGCTSVNDCKNSYTQCMMTVPTFTCPSGPEINLVKPGDTDCACPGLYRYNWMPCEEVMCQPI